MSLDKKKIEEALRVLSSIVKDDPPHHDEPSSSDPPAQSDLPPSACRLALTNLREIRAGFAPYSQNFDDRKGKRRKRTATSTSFGASNNVGWMHKFVCLPRTDQEKVPTAGEKILLSNCGLGEKLVKFHSVEMSYREVVEVLCRAYPKLSDGGGVEFLRCPPNSRELVPINLSGSGSSLLTTVLSSVGQGRVFVRPIQCDLSLQVDAKDRQEGSSEPMERCLNCSEEFAISVLRSHARSCSGAAVQSSDIVKKPPSTESYEAPWEQWAFEFDDSQSLPPVEIGFESTQSFQSLETGEPSTKKRRRSINELMSVLSSEVNPGPTMCIEVRRDFVLSDSLKVANRKGFSPLKKIKVEFVGELAEDCGGPLRELWMLLCSEFEARMCKGSKGNGILTHDAVALQEKRYFAMGQLIAAGIIQSGAKFPLFSITVYEYLAGKPVADLSPEVGSIPDQNVVTFLQKVQNVGEVEELREIMFEGNDILVDAGYQSPIINAQLENKKAICDVVSLHYGLLIIKAELDQLRSGLMHNSGQLMESIGEYRDEFQYYFHGGEVALTADAIMSLFVDKVFSEKGLNCRIKEEETFIWFKEFLVEIEDSEDVSLEDVLFFFTASKYLPVGPAKASMSFSDDQLYPTASTCTMHLVLPLLSSYDTFCDRCKVAFRNNTGFGLI